MNINRRSLLGSAGALCLSSAFPALAKSSFPSRPIKIVVPFAPGGSNDLGARLLTPHLSQAFGQPVIIENKGGAGGSIGAQTVARAEPDGHTILFHSNSIVIQPHLMKNAGYNATADFEPISLLGQAPLVLVVNPAVPANNFSEFLEYARANKKDIFYGSAGIAAVQHLAGELFNRMANTQMQHVPFKGSGPALAAVASGEIQATFDIIPTSRPMAQAGRVRMLAVTSERRNASVPELPTIHESGVPDYIINFWQSMYLPKGTPEEIKAAWFHALKNAMKTQDVQQRVTDMGYEIVLSEPEELAQIMQNESQKWQNIIKQVGVSSET